MASVHLGRLLGPVGFSRTVAIKKLHAHFAKDEEFVSMFIDEARLAARVRHPNVVQTLDVVQTNDQLLLVMEYVHGAQLSVLTRLANKAGQRIPQPIVAAILAGMLRGLHAAHEAQDERGQPLNIVHRDVSPHNVMVGTDGIARVIDFGVAKAAGRLQHSNSGQLKGKIPYMAPEQVRGEAVSRRTDVFAAGVVLWECLLGKRLFVADNDAAIIGQVLSHEIDPPSRVDFAVPAAFDEVVMRALERSPAKRFQTARDMAKALEACGPVAPPAEVSEWVEAIARDVLEKRQGLVSQVESSSAMPVLAATTARDVLTGVSESGIKVAPASTASTTESQVSSVAIAMTNSRGAGPPVGLIAGLLGVAAMAGAGFLIARQILREPPPPVPMAAASTALPRASAEPIPSASASASASATAAPTASVKPKPKPVGPIPLTAAPKGDCDPPYTFDAKGMKKYKPHCL